MLLIGIAASSSFQTNRDVTLRPGQSAERRRLRGHLRAADRRRRPTSASPSARCSTCSATARTSPCSARAAATSARPGEPSGTISQLLRRRGDQRGRPEGRRSAATSGPRSSPNIDGSRSAASRAADRGFRDLRPRRRPGTPPQCRALARADAERRRRPALRRDGAGPDRRAAVDDANRVADSYLADAAAVTFRVIVNPLVDLDVDRRPDRPGRRPDRDLAHPGRPPAPRRQRRGGPARPRALAGLSGAAALVSARDGDPLRRHPARPRRCVRAAAAATASAGQAGEDPRIADLEARKEAKYREIRDARARPRRRQALR